MQYIVLKYTILYSGCQEGCPTLSLSPDTAAGSDPTARTPLWRRP